MCPYLDGDGGLPLKAGEEATVNWAFKTPINPFGEVDITVKWGEAQSVLVRTGQTLVVTGDGTAHNVIG